LNQAEWNEKVNVEKLKQVVS